MLGFNRSLRFDDKHNDDSITLGLNWQPRRNLIVRSEIRRDNNGYLDPDAHRPYFPLAV